jgi:hypothetical protein
MVHLTYNAGDKMKSKIIRTEPVVELELTAREAFLLKGLVQNPISEDESIEVTELRETLWNALKDVK